MIRFKIFTLFPEIFTSFLSQSLIKKAIDRDKLEVELINFREFGIGKHQKVDDKPYGGGVGMLLRPEPIVNALLEYDAKIPDQKMHKILISPQGKVFSQKKACILSNMSHPIALVCGRYEGFDQRVRYFVDEEISLGDFIVMGGEIPSMALIESAIRLAPGILGNANSIEEESFSQGVLEYAQYTKPADFMGYRVPEILFSGHHQKIQEWRVQNALKKTRSNRPDLK